MFFPDRFQSQDSESLGSLCQPSVLNMLLMAEIVSLLNLFSIINITIGIEIVFGLTEIHISSGLFSI